MTAPHGASPDDWAHFSILLGLTADLLPVVSNPKAQIAPESKMRDIGKVPSRYNSQRNVVGFAQWTQHVTTDAEITSWSKQPDYGIALQTRATRALDCDISDATQAQEIATIIDQTVGCLPCRMRNNANKFLLAFTLPGDLPKRVIKTQHGAIEFLASGQQFIAVGTHPSGVRYDWPGGLPDEFPVLTLDQFENLWSLLAAKFAIEPPVEGKTATRTQTIADAASADPVGRFLLDHSWVKSTERDGRLHIRCPFEGEHTAGSTESATTYFPAHTGGYARGHFRCLHAHCTQRSDSEFLQAVGVEVDDFDEVVESSDSAELPSARFAVVPAHEFAGGEPPRWIIKDVLPQAGLAVVFGDSGSGKTFFVLDISAAVAQGGTWRDKRVTQGRVVYIVAEGAGGFRNRLQAYSRHHNTDLASLDIGVIGDAPNFMLPADIKAVLASVQAFGKTDVIIVDTFAQVMPGANENSGEDVGRALQHCRILHKHTGALIVLVHHSGKDAAKGARGWSGLRAAADAEIEIVRSDNDRVATVTKLKDGSDGTEFGFRLNTVILGQDDDGDEITSCVLEHTAVIPKNQRNLAPKGTNEKLVMRILKDTDEIHVTQLVSTVIDQMVPPEDGKRDRRREVVVRSIETLIANGQLRRDGTRLRLASE